MIGFFKGLLAMMMAFALGFSAGSDRDTNPELKQKVQEHLDVIEDEAAAMADDIAAEIRNDEHVKEAEDFLDDVNEIIDNTIKDIDEHFGAKDGEEETEETTAVEEVEEATTAEEETEAPETEEAVEETTAAE